MLSFVLAVYIAREGEGVGCSLTCLMVGFCCFSSHWDMVNRNFRRVSNWIWRYGFWEKGQCEVDEHCRTAHD